MLDAQRIRELLAEARSDLNRYDALRANTMDIIASYEMRLMLLGTDGLTLPLPGVEQTMNSPPKGPPPASNTVLFEQVVNDSAGPLNAREVWSEALKRGARSQSANPSRVVDVILRDLAEKGRIEIAGRGLYQKKNEATFQP